MHVIYEITDTITNLKYIGSKRNWKGNGTYFGSLGCKCERLKKYKLQQEWKESVKSRPLTFSFRILESFEEISNKDLINKELEYQKKYNVVKSEQYVNAGYAMYCGGLGGKPGMKSGLKSKSYDQIYGDRAEAEREKRKVSLLGKPKPAAVGQKIAKALSGKTPWNKGLSLTNPNVNEYSKKSAQTRKGLKIGSYSKITKYKLINSETSEVIIEVEGSLNLLPEIKKLKKELILTWANIKELTSKGTYQKYKIEKQKCLR